MSPTVGVNLLWLVPGVVGGSETSTVTTLGAIAAAPPGDMHHVLFALESFTDAHPELAGSFDVETLALSGRFKGLRVGAEQTWLAARMRRRGMSAAHHMGGTMPLVPGPPGVLSIHDLQPFDHPEHFHPAKRAWLNRVVPRSVARAVVVLTPSEWVRQTVIDRFGVDPHQVVSAPHGIPPLVAPTPPAVLRNRYDITGPFVIYPAITYPHKDHLTLVRAMSRLADHHRDLTLVLPGGIGPAEADISAEITRSGVAHRTRRLGRIPAADLSGLLDEATIVAFPSRYEGFGMPLLEAMVRGRPVVAADATAIPEVVADGARLVAPAVVDAWVEALDSLLADPDARARLGERGRVRAAMFTPDRTASATISAHRRALAAAPN